MAGSTLLTPMLEAGGSPLAAKWVNALIEVTVDHELQVPSRITLRFVDPGYALLASGAMAIGTALTVKAPDGTAIGKGEIVGVAAEQREGEQPELVVTAYDKSHRASRTTRIKVYNKVTYSDVVSQLATTLGLSADVTATTVQLPYLMQADSDLGLLTELARRLGWDWWVDAKETLHFGPPATATTVPLTLGVDLRSFSARAAATVPDSVEVDGWDRDQQQAVTSTVTEASTVVASSDLAELASGATSTFGDTKIVAGGLGVMGTAEAKLLAQNILNRAATCAVTAKGVADGNAGIALGNAVQVKGAGPLNGTYPVTRVEHRYRPSSGYVTRFACGERRPSSLVESLSGRTANAYAGPAHRRDGVTVGEVTNIKDPNDYGRVKVRYPGVSQEFETDWARVVSPGGGKSRGGTWIPEVGDEVLVAFEGGDARQPVVLGGLYGSKSTMPTTQVSNGQVQSRGLTSRQGHRVTLFDGDSTAKQAVEIGLSGDEHLLHLGKDKLDLVVPNGLPVNITAGSTKIAFSDSGNVSIEGVDISIKAKGKLTLEGAEVTITGQGKLAAKSSGQTQLAGVQTEVSGDAMTKISGGMVQIN